MNHEIMNESDEERSRRRRQRIQEMKRQKERAELLQKKVFPAVMLVLVILLAAGITGLVRHGRNDAEKVSEQQLTAQELTEKELTVQELTAQELSSEGIDPAAENGDETVYAGTVSTPQSESEIAKQPVGQNYGESFGPFPTPKPEPEAYTASATAATTGFPDKVISEYGVLIDVENGTILAQRSGKERINPASMTKILTVLTAANALGIEGEDWMDSPILDEKYTITIEITDYSFVNDCSNVGFDVGEEVTVRDLFYGTILPSGADAALGLAFYVAGSQEAFVDLMNQELERMNLSETTHFTNCVGLYDENHYSTTYDMAVILKTAADNPFCRAVLSAHTYNTSATEQHPEGLLISNWFLRRIEDKDTHGEVICGKTGYVVQSRNCAASLAEDANGKEYICVTAGSSSTWNCIYDHVELYQTWLAGE